MGFNKHISAVLAIITMVVFFAIFVLLPYNLLNPILNNPEDETIKLCVSFGVGCILFLFFCSLTPRMGK